MSTASTVEREMLALINQERTSRGLILLQLETQLNESSEDHSMWMLDTDRFSHTGAGGSSATQRIEAAGFDLEGSWRTGENIAWQSERGAPGISDDVAQLHQNLMNSPGHRANILNPDFRYIGIGIETGDMQGFDAVMVTQNFAATNAAVELDTGTAPPPTDDVAQPADPEPEDETPVVDVTDPVPPVDETPAPDTEDPVAEVETPDEDDTEEDTPVAETDDPEVEDETPVAETDDPEDEGETPVAETDDPEDEGETPVAETDDPEDEGETPVAETDDPEEDTEAPGDDVAEGETPDVDSPVAECFDLQAFLAEIEAFVQLLQARLDQFDWDAPNDPESEADEFELVTDTGSDDDLPVADDVVDVVADDCGDFTYFYSTCVMEVA